MSLSCTSWQSFSLVTLCCCCCYIFQWALVYFSQHLAKIIHQRGPGLRKKKFVSSCRPWKFTSDADVKRSFFWEMYHLQKLHRLCTHAPQCINVLLIKPSLCIHAQSYKNMKVVTTVQTESSPSSISKLLIHRRV